MTIKTLRPLTSGYGAWRRFCGLSVPNDTSELAEILRNSTLAHKLQLLYGTPHNIDVWVGAISEPPLPGGRVGPLLSCLLARQFRALRDGDRYKNKTNKNKIFRSFLVLFQIFLPSEVLVGEGRRVQRRPEEAPARRLAVPHHLRQQPHHSRPRRPLLPHREAGGHAALLPPAGPATRPRPLEGTRLR